MCPIYCWIEQPEFMGYIDTFSIHLPYFWAWKQFSVTRLLHEDFSQHIHFVIGVFL